MYSALARGGPEWATAIVRSGQGGAVAHRNINREDYISRYEIDYENLKSQRKADLRAFAILRQGMAAAFRFLAPDDSVCVKEGVGYFDPSTYEINYLTQTDGTLKDFFIIKTYSDSSSRYIRRIVKPSPLDDWTIFIYANNALVQSEIFPRVAQIKGQPMAGSKSITLPAPFGVVTLDFNEGKLLFNTPPPAGHSILVSGVYHLPVAFTEDWQKYSIDEATTGSISIGLEEVLPVELGLPDSGGSAGSLLMAVITAPTANAVVSGNFLFSATASAGAAAVQFFLDDNLIGEKTSAPFEVTVDSRLYGNGSHTLRAAASAGGSIAYSQITAVNFQNLGVPVLTGAKIGSSSVKLDWTAVAGATGYKLWRDGYVTAVGNVLSYALGSLPTGINNFKVLASANSVESAYSNQVSINLPAYTSPSAPTNFTVTQNSPSLVTMSWTASTPGTFPVAGYLLWRDGYIVDVGNVTAYPVGSLPPGTYNFKVQAYDSDNNYSAYTSIVSITLAGAPQPPTASFTKSAASGIAPLTVDFTDTSANLPTSWLWNFGDGSATSTSKNPSHVFSTSGTFTVTLTATNAAGSNQTSQTVIVSSAPAGVGPLASMTLTNHGADLLAFDETAANQDDLMAGIGTIMKRLGANNTAAIGLAAVTLTNHNTDLVYFNEQDADADDLIAATGMVLKLMGANGGTVTDLSPVTVEGHSADILAFDQTGATIGDLPQVLATIMKLLGANLA